MHRIFSEGGFARVLRAGDSRRYKIDLKTNRDSIIQQAIDTANSTSPITSGIHKAKVKNRPCVSIKNYSLSLIFRSISFYLTRRFKIFPRGRDSIVREIIETLADSTPMYVVRRDLSSFYESLVTSKLQEQFEYNLFIPPTINHHIRFFFSSLCGKDRGIPRGVGMSSSIAELIMRQTDQRFREIPGVYKYFRYADDILIFSWIHPSNLYGELNAIVGEVDLKFNPDKSNEIRLDCSDKSKRIEVGFEYLGYRFRMHNGHGDNSPRAVAVALSDRKIARLKTRLICSLKHYKKNKDFEILFDRIQFLSSNYFAYRNGAAAIKTSKFVKSGLYYNYHLCGIYKSGKRTPSACNELKALDAFYHFLLKGKGSSFRTLFNGPSGKTQLQKLEQLSFYKGFDKKMTVRFQPDRVQQIKAAWRNE